MRSHLWITLIGTVAVLLLAVMLIFQTYLKRQYYNYLLSETEKTEQTLMDSTVNDLNNRLETTIRTASEVATNSTLQTYAFAAVEDRRNLTGNYTGVINELSTLIRFNDDMVAITLAAKDDVLVEYGQFWYGSRSEDLWSGENLTILGEIYDGLTEQLESGSSRRYWVETEPSTHSAFTDIQLFHIAAPLIIEDDSNTGVEVMAISTFRLDTMLSGALSKDNESGLIGYITDADGRIFYHQDDVYDGYDLETYHDEIQNIDMEEPLEYFGWTVHIDIDVAGMRARVNRVYRNDLLLFIILIAGIVAVWQFIFRYFLRTIDSIREAMTDIESGDLERQIPIEGTNELWALADQYNDMVTQLRAQREETHRHYLQTIASIEEKNRAEKMALESQIDAHFLCNILTALHYDALDNGNLNLSKLLKQLSEMLHYTLSTRNEFTTVGQEIKWAEEYLTLQKFRRMDLFDYEIRFPEVYSEWPCCKQFFQPFVENSISHGFEYMDSGGKIILSGDVEGDCLRMELSDNGCGMSEEVSASVERVLNGEAGAMVISQSDSGYGIRNVTARLRMFYGPGLRIRIESEEGKGTRYIFWLPIPASLGEENLDEGIDEGGIEV